MDTTDSKSRMLQLGFASSRCVFHIVDTI